MAIINHRTSVLSSLISERVKAGSQKFLVVGCGSGIEAAILAQDFNADVIGIDLKHNFDHEASKIARLQHGDATSLKFNDETFDIVYCYHALEHIPEYHKAISEMHRVIRPLGLCCISTPNRSRMIGYVGGNSSLHEKLAWNLSDWRMRFKGKFKNEYGSHAGYTSKELSNILSAHFSDVEDITNNYYCRLYFRAKIFIRFLIDSGISRRLFPSVCFIATK